MFSILVLFAASAGSAPAAPPPATEDDPIVCVKVNVGEEVGTHIRAKKKVCMKKSDREFIEQQTQRTLDNINNSGNTNPGLIPKPR